MWCAIALQGRPFLTHQEGAVVDHLRCFCCFNDAAPTAANSGEDEHPRIGRPSQEMVNIRESVVDRIPPGIGKFPCFRHTHHSRCSFRKPHSPRFTQTFDTAAPGGFSHGRKSGPMRWGNEVCRATRGSGERAVEGCRSRAGKRVQKRTYKTDLSRDRSDSAPIDFCPRSHPPCPLCGPGQVPNPVRA